MPIELSDEYQWRMMPFVRLLPPFLKGIILAVYQPWLELFSIPCLAFGLLAVLSNRRLSRWRWRRWSESILYIALCALLFGLGLLMVDVHRTSDESAHFSNMDETELYQVRLSSTPEEKANTYAVKVETEYALSEGDWTKVLGKQLLYVQKSSAVMDAGVGDRWLIPANSKALHAPSNPEQFDFRAFLAKKDIYHQAYVKSQEWKLVSKGSGPFRWAESGRAALESCLRQIDMSADRNAIANALLLGKKEYIPDELRDSYAGAGAMHVLAVSGLHVGIIYLMLAWLLKLMPKYRYSHFVRTALLILILWIYAFLTGLSPSVVRAATMFSAVALAQGIGRRGDIYNTICSSAFLLLLFNPMYLFEVGFQLSYIAVLGIVYLHPRIYAWLYTPYYLLDKIWEVTAVSIAAQLVTFPLALYYFHIFPNYFLLSNLIVFPCAFLILGVGLAYLAFFWVPGLGDLLGYLLELSLALINGGVSAVSELPMAVTEGIHITAIETLLLYFVIIIISLALIARWKRLTYAAFLAIVLLIVLQVKEEKELMETNRLLVFDVQGSSVWNIHTPEYHILHLDTSRTPLSKIDFQTGEYWGKMELDSPELRSDVVAGAKVGAWTISEKRILALNSRTKLHPDSTGQAVDVFILGRDCRYQVESYLEHIDAKHIVLDSSWRPWDIDQVREQVQGHSGLHIVPEEGYFQLEL